MARQLPRRASGSRPNSVRLLISATAAALLITATPAAIPTAQAAPAHPAQRQPRTTPAPEAIGSFAFQTANGILPTWELESLRLAGISPGRTITSMTNANANVSMPVVAREGSTTFTAGGFRIANTETGVYVNCFIPAIDTRARVIDCRMKDGTNRQLLAMNRIGARKVITGPAAITRMWSQISLSVADQISADYLNDELSTNIFSPSVTFANAELTVITQN